VRRLLTAAAAALALPVLTAPLLLLAPSALAADPASAAITAFRGGDHVYVDPAAEEAGKIDEPKVAGRISSDAVDVYVAVLPDSARGGGTPDALLKQMGGQLTGDATLALVVGRHFNAGSSALGRGEAAALATEAINQHPGNVNDTLTAFVDKVGAANGSRRSSGVDPVRTTSPNNSGFGLFLPVLVIGGLAVFALSFFRRRGGRRKQTDSLKADAQRWYERLGGEVLNLSAGDNVSARQALADASERYNAAGSALSGARSDADYAAARDTALEGLHFARAARTSLGIDAGPELPPTSVQQAAGQVTAEQQIQLGGQQIDMRPDYAANTPYYYPGGIVGGGRVPGGYYSQPFWKTALIGGAAGLGGLLVADALFDAVRGPFGGGMFGGGFGYGGGMFGGGGYGYGGGYGGGYDQGGGGGDQGGGGGGDFGGGGDWGGAGISVVAATSAEAVVGTSEPAAAGTPQPAPPARIPTSWAKVRRRLEQARNYWIVTSRPDGRPHAAPVWGVWLDGRLWFSTSPASVKARNLAADPRVVVHLERADTVPWRLPTGDRARSVTG